MTNELYLEPQNILSLLKEEFGRDYSEMTGWQLGFLCGLIKETKPKKIVEIGVSAGGTTAVLLNTLSLLGLNSTLYSVDYSDTYYKDRKKKTGFVAEWIKKYIKERTDVEWVHKLRTGGGICNYLTEIGSGIDFLILDTMHVCPGEILDFLACFPYLEKNAVVVMHDIAMQYANNRDAYATQLLLDTVTADKIVGRDENSGYYTYPNIGAFKINGDTEKYIGDVFSCLNIPWTYIPEELELYRDTYIANYNDSVIELFDIASKNNKRICLKDEENQLFEIDKYIRLVKRIENHDVYIYGNGKVGKKINIVLSNAGINILGHIVSDGEEKGGNALYLGEIDSTDNYLIIVGVGPKLQPEIREELESNGIYDYVVFE